MPPEDVIEATSLTPNALYYGDSGWLEHKIILAGERGHRNDEEQADRTAAIRQLISEGRITKVVTLNMKTETIEQRGPIVFCETTTSNSIFNEDLNRVLQIYTDASHDQTKNVVIATAGEWMDRPSESDFQLILDRHHEFQRSLNFIDVRIPYAVDLASRLPTQRIESRRIIKQVLATIECVAFLHQHNRDLDKHGRLIATPEDYKVARRLLLEPLNQAIGLKDAARKNYSKLKKKFPKGFNSNQALKAGCFKGKMSRDRALKELVELDVLNCVAKGKSHTPVRWAWTEKSLAEMILPKLGNFITKGE